MYAADRRRQLLQQRQRPGLGRLARGGTLCRAAAIGDGLRAGHGTEPVRRGLCVCTCVHVHVCRRACLCVLAHGRMSVCMRAYVYVHMCMCVCAYVHVHGCERVNALVRVRVWVHVHGHVYARVCPCAWVHVCVCAFVGVRAQTRVVGGSGRAFTTLRACPYQQGSRVCLYQHSCKGVWGGLARYQLFDAVLNAHDA